VTDPDTTFPKLLARLAQTHPRRRALQEKRYGIWQALTWEEYEAAVRRVAHGLAAHALGGISVGLYPDGVIEEVEHVIEHAGVRLVVAEDQEQVDKLIALRDAGRIATVERIVYYDPHGLEQYARDDLIELTEVERLGSEFEREHPGWIDGEIEQGRASDVAILCTTSGTTAKPKLAMLTYANLLSMGESLMSIDPIKSHDEFVSFLPLAWIGEQMLALGCALQAGFALSFPESDATVRADLREIGPRVMFSPPRIWQSLLSSVQVRLADAGWLKRAVFGVGYAIGVRAAERRLHGRRRGPLLFVAHALAEWAALRPVRNQLGLVRLRRAYTGGAPLGPDVFKFFHAIGVNLKQIYGQTEISGIAVVHRDGDIRFNSVGVPLPGAELEIAANGEVLLRSPAVFLGYFRNEAGTAEALRDGWLHTGDAGYLEADGHLVVIDRANDVLKAADGTLFSPAFVENKLKFSTHVDEAVIFGGSNRPFVTAMISIDPETVGTWAERNHISYTTYTDLAQKPEVSALVGEAVARANEDLPESIRIRRFVLLHKQLDADDEELTRTRKVRRTTINRRYGDIVDALYGDADEVTITTVVTYQDGSQAESEITLALASADGAAPPPAKRRIRELIGAGS
jgi:long-chain acyl-CoA synthetase